MSHGLIANRFIYSTICSELASFGYIVFSIDHFDGSGTYTEDVDGTPVKFDTNCPMNDRGVIDGKNQQYLSKSILKRKDEISELLDEISKDGFCKQKLNVRHLEKIDHSKIVLAGHSFGSTSNLFSGVQLP